MQNDSQKKFSKSPSQFNIPSVTVDDLKNDPNPTVVIEGCNNYVPKIVSFENLQEKVKTEEFCVGKVMKIEPNGSRFEYPVFNAVIPEKDYNNIVFSPSKKTIDTKKIPHLTNSPESDKTSRHR